MIFSLDKMRYFAVYWHNYYYLYYIISFYNLQHLLVLLRLVLTPGLQRGFSVWPNFTYEEWFYAISYTVSDNATTCDSNIYYLECFADWWDSLDKLDCVNTIYKSIKCSIRFTSYAFKHNRKQSYNGLLGENTQWPNLWHAPPPPTSSPPPPVLLSPEN